jgi:glycosyltransferase involved in cell wall biosynthesis
MNKYILEPRLPKWLHAGSKARDDVNFFLEGCDYKPIVFDVNESKRFIIKAKNYALCLMNIERIINNMESDSILLLQYPYYFNPIVFEYILRKAVKKGIKLVALVHDVDALRFSRDREAINKEINYLNCFTAVVSHNPHMTQWLKENGLKSPVIDLEVFDYKVKAVERAIEKSSNPRKAIVFAGNLSVNKSKFLYSFADEILKECSMNLYGIDFDAENFKCKNSSYKGAFQPDELPGIIEGDFGLIWDGSELNTCSGDYGQYLRYNNPHKLSLYIAAGLPVVTWKKAAISSFISNNRIGVLVDSLTEMSDAISELDNNKYLEMKNNVRDLQRKVTSGHYVQSAVSRIEESFNKGVNHAL